MPTHPVPDLEKIWNDIFKNKVEKDDPLWQEYAEKAATFDERIIDGWNKIVDVILLTVGIPCYSSQYYLFMIGLNIGCANHFRPDFLRYSNLFTTTKRPSCYH